MTIDLCDPQAALRRAAEIGPGYRGERQEASEEERAEVAEALRQLNLGIPAYLEKPTSWIERRAKLFEIGDYRDKGVSVEMEHLRALVANFDLPVPVLIEHSESPLELGYLTSVHVVGGELHGTLMLTAEANTLVDRSGAKKLSLGLAADLSRIREVSLVRHPRVKDARMFAGHCFIARLDSDDSAAVKTEEYVRQGRLTPATIRFVEPLLACEETVVFNGTSVSVSTLVAALLDALPTSVKFGPSAPTRNTDYSRQLLLPEEVAFYQRYFPDIDLDEIAARR